MRTNEVEFIPHPNIGDNAPDAEVVLASNCTTTLLSSYWSDSPTLFVFMRHLGCSFCREQVGHLFEINSEVISAGVRIALISVNRPEETHRFCLSRNLGDHYACLSDPTRVAYAKYGLSRVSSPHLITPHVLSRGIQAVLHGHFSAIPKADPLQMPGVFLVDINGIVRYVHRNKDAADNPANTAILEAISSLH